MREYDFAADYDAQYSAAYEPEIRVLTELAKEQGGRVLDLCCGTGIVTIPLAETGLEVVGVDISEAMLAQAQAKAKGRQNLTFLPARCARVQYLTAFWAHLDDRERLSVLSDRQRPNHAFCQGLRASQSGRHVYLRYTVT